MLNPYISYHLLRGDKGESRHHLPKHSVRAANVPHQTFGNAKCHHEHSCDVCVALWRLKQNQRKLLVLIEHMHWKPKTLQTVWQIVTNDGKNPRTTLSHLISYITQNSNASQQAEELRSTSHALWSPKSHFQQLQGFWIILVQYMSHSASYSLYWSLLSLIVAARPGPLKPSFQSSAFSENSKSYAKFHWKLKEWVEKGQVLSQQIHTRLNSIQNSEVNQLIMVWFHIFPNSGISWSFMIQNQMDLIQHNDNPHSRLITAAFDIAHFSNEWG